jgi:hypothetical protein
MTVTPPLVVPILATPFGVVPLADAAALNPALLALFAARIRADGQGGQRNPLCHRGRDDLLEWPEAPVRRLGAAILRGVSAVVRDVNELSEAELNSFAVQARGWFTVVETNGRIAAASHPLTAWCAVYCVAAPAAASARPDSGVLRLYESRLGTMFADATTAAMRKPFTPGHYSWRPVPGQMAVFPASLTHEIALVRSAGQLVLVTVRLRFVAPGQQGAARW